MKTGEFHWTDCWYFSRTEDGSVHIEKRSDGQDDSPALVSLTIPSLEWVSIIAHVGSGEQSEDFGKALALHLIKFDIAPTTKE